MRRLNESGTFEWQWSARRGLAIVIGGSGGGGGGGGAFCIDGLNLFGAIGGSGGEGGDETTITVRKRTYSAAGGRGGDGGDAGGFADGTPLKANEGRGCNHGNGGQGGSGGQVAKPDLAPHRNLSNGGDGGKGFPGETLIVELHSLSVGDRFSVIIGDGGGPGEGGSGFVNGSKGTQGMDGAVIFVPLFQEQNSK